MEVFKLHHRLKLCHRHVEDISLLYITLLEAAVEGNMLPHGTTGGAYFASTGCLLLGEISQNIADELYKRKLIPTSEASRFESHEAAAKSLHTTPEWVEIVWGADANWKAEKAEQCGWRPSRRLPDWEEEVEIVKRSGWDFPSK